MTIYLYNTTSNEIIATLSNVVSYKKNRIVFTESIENEAGETESVLNKIGGFADDTEFAVSDSDDTFDNATKACRAAASE